LVKTEPTAANKSNSVAAVSEPKGD